MIKAMPAKNQGPGSPRRADLIASLNRAVREATGLGVVFGEAVAARLGINSTDLECLGLIAGADRVTAGALAAATGLTTGAVTGVIDRLEKAKLARRERDAADRRRVYVRLTGVAGARATAYYDSLGSAADRLAASYGTAEIALLVDYFVRSRELILREIGKLKPKR